ncbi:MAG: hypothetical protein R3F08_03560 [Dokdonella sp.]|nr:hypothetical protein [Dokdonella sp.]MCB1570534.1 hypothetical protein [Xanthomonadales bacterium]MCB1572641.1 hypothetical protein [Xanthomonadales bacterium]
MKKFMLTVRATFLLVMLAMFLSTAAHAGDVRDGRAIVTPAKEDRYKIGSYTFGKAELFGYISELKETKKITGIVLKNGYSDSNKATDEQRHSIASIGKTLQLETFTQDGRELEPLSND